MAFKKFRKMKVYNVSGYNYKDTPTIILKGDWLKETGFDIGSLIQVECENGKLIITPREPEEYIMSRNGVDFIPSSMVLSAVDAKLRIEMGAERILAGILEPLRDRYDYILIDICPSLGALTINALAVADEVIIAANPQLLAMMGLQDFLKSVRKIKNRINSKLEVAGILLTMCEARTNLCKVITEQVSETFAGQLRIFDSKIPNTVKVGESVYYSEPLLEYAPGCKACKAYQNLAKELIENEG